MNQTFHLSGKVFYIWKTPRGAVHNRLYAPMFISRYLQLLVTTFTTQAQLNHRKQNS